MPSQAPFITLSPHRLDVAQRLADACSHLRVREAWYELQHVRVQLPISANGLRPWAIAFVAWFDFLLTVGWGSVFSLRFPSNYCDEWSTSCPHRKVSFPDSELLDFPWAEINWPWSCMKWKLFDAFCIFPNLGSTNNGIQWLEIIWYLQLLNAGPLCYATICNPRLFFISSQAKVLKSDLASEFDVECYCQTAWRKIQTVQFKKEIQTICQFCCSTRIIHIDMCRETARSLMTSSNSGKLTWMVMQPRNFEPKKNLILQAFAVSSLSLLALQIRLAGEWSHEYQRRDDKWW